MKKGVITAISAVLLIFSLNIRAQNQQSEIDSLVNKMRTAGREWNTYAEPLIKIGEPAVAALIENARDTSLSLWNRRIIMTTLNTIHSEQWVEPALEILFDENEAPEIRNRTTAGLSGFDLSHVNTKLWELFSGFENQFYKSNIAHLLLSADTAMAYRAFYELYQTQDGHIGRNALQKLAFLRPGESTNWYLNALQGEDWMTANLAIDSLISASSLNADLLLSVYYLPDIDEEVQWRIVYVLSQRINSANIPFFCEALKSESWLVRTESAIALTKLNKEEVLKQLVVLQNDSAEVVRNNARWVIRELSNSD